MNAFPIQPVVVEGCTVYQYGQDGMALRDYFAAHAPLGNEVSLEDLCAFRYRYADAMMKAREQS